MNLSFFQRFMTICRDDLSKAGVGTEHDLPPSENAPVYKFASTQLDLNPQTAKLVQDWSYQTIDSDDLDEAKGREMESHVTVKYGLLDDSPVAVKKALAGFDFIVLGFGHLAVFDTQPDHDVLYLSVISPSIVKANALITEKVECKSSDYGAYIPHMTIAYLKKGAAAKYLLMPPPSLGLQIFNVVTLSNRNGLKIPIYLSFPIISGLNKALASGCYTNPKSCDLRWITVHPNGDDSRGVPLLVHDNGEEYTVVGGAGGSMNQSVFKKPAGHGASASKQKSIRRAAIRRQKAAEMSKDERTHLENKKALEQEAAKQTSDLRNKILEKLGVNLDRDVIGDVKKEAERRAAQEKADATPEEKEEFVKKAVSGAKDEASKAVDQIIRDALNHTAMRSLGEDAAAGDGKDFKGQIAGKNLVKHFTSQELHDFVSHAATIASLKGKAKAIARALSSGNEVAIQGLEAAMKPLSDDEVKKFGIDKYMTDRDVDANTNLVKESEKAPIVSQNRNQANGASDALNAFVANMTGKAVLTPDVTKLLGVENAARVAAEYLKSKQADIGKSASDLRSRIAHQSYASIAASLGKVKDMDDIVQQTRDAADAGDGSVTKAQASIVKANMAQRKYQLLGVTRGQLRSAAAMAMHLEDKRQTAMNINGGATAVGASARAKGLGLDEGDFKVEKAKGGGYQISIPSDKIVKLAREHSLAESDRNIAMDELRQEVETNPGQWHPEGLNKNVRLQPQQELLARAIAMNKGVVGNLGAGSGKTPAMYAAAADLLSSGKCDKGLITMPAKPRAQQNDYTEDGKTKTGEKMKFLTPEMASKVAVVKDGADLTTQLKAISEGSKKLLIISPALMRERIADLKAAGFGGPKTFFFADEAHEFAIGDKDGAGSGMANAAKELMKSEYRAAMSGTLIENNASELASVYDMVHPGSLGNVKQFAGEWKRLAQGQSDMFSSEAMRGMRDRLSGGMVSYHKPVTKKDEHGNEHALTLEKHVVKVETTPEQRAAIAKVHEQYSKDKLSEDDGKRRAAALTRDARISKILNTGENNPKLDVIRRIQEDELKRDPKNRVGVYSPEIAPLKQGMKALKGKVISVTGANDDKQTREALDKINDRTNDYAGIGISNAGNYGINVQGMDHLIKMSPLDVPSKEDQLDHRHFRTGQTRNVRATTIMANHPVETMKQFRNRNVKLPEVSLLAQLADDTNKANILTRHQRAVDEAAGGQANA